MKLIYNMIIQNQGLQGQIGGFDISFQNHIYIILNQNLLVYSLKKLLQSKLFLYFYLSFKDISLNHQSFELNSIKKLLCCNNFFQEKINEILQKKQNPFLESLQFSKYMRSLKKNPSQIKVSKGPLYNYKSPIVSICFNNKYIYNLIIKKQNQISYEIESIQEGKSINWIKTQDKHIFAFAGLYIKLYLYYPNSNGFKKTLIFNQNTHTQFILLSYDKQSYYMTYLENDQLKIHKNPINSQIYVFHKLFSFKIKCYFQIYSLNTGWLLTHQNNFITINHQGLISKQLNKQQLENIQNQVKNKFCKISTIEHILYHKQSSHKLIDAYIGIQLLSNPKLLTLCLYSSQISINKIIQLFVKNIQYVRFEDLILPQFAIQWSDFDLIIKTYEKNDQDFIVCLYQNLKQKKDQIYQKIMFHIQKKSQQMSNYYTEQVKLIRSKLNININTNEQKKGIYKCCLTGQTLEKGWKCVQCKCLTLQNYHRNICLICWSRLKHIQLF